MIFPRLNRESAAAEAARLIREKILSGELRAGQRLPGERELSEAFGISRPTIRETLRTLAAMNILESRHGSGTFVSDLGPQTLTEPLRFAMALSPTTVTELFEARLLIEPELAALAAQRSTEDQRRRLSACVTRTGESRDDPAALLALDLELHSLIAEAAHNALLSQMLETLSGLGRDSRAVTVTVPGVAEATIAEHTAIAVAVVDADVDAARGAMTRHLRRIGDAALAASAGVPAPRSTGRTRKSGTRSTS
jgi:GntR family transcriptional regulator, transcriptional repressor for pyruvate dehydrogenase complex